MSFFAKNTLVSIASTIDYLFAQIFEYYFSNFPTSLSLENQSLTFNELKNIAKVEDAQKFLINREVETLLIRKGINEKLEIIKKDIEVAVPTNSSFISDLRKIIKIRNLIVHNEGRADAEYEKLYGEEKIKAKEMLKIEAQYLKDSLELVYFVGSYILQGMQKKYSEKPIHKNDYIINNVIHDLVKKNQYSLIRPIYDYAIVEGNLDDINRKMVIINFCIGLKKQGKENEHIKQVLLKEDWSLVSKDFEMTLSILYGELETFYKILEELILSKEIGKDELLDWEVFTLCKNQVRFKRILKNLSIS